MKELEDRERPQPGPQLPQRTRSTGSLPDHPEARFLPLLLRRPPRARVSLPAQVNTPPCGVILLMGRSRPGIEQPWIDSWEARVNSLIRCLIAVSVLAGPACAPDTDLKGPYFGQTPPGREPVIFAPGIISTSATAHSFPAFSPDTVHRDE